MNPALAATDSAPHTHRDGVAHDKRNPGTAPVKPVLSEEMLARFASRAAGYDQQNRFFAEDFEELRAAKYLLLPLPTEFGGAGMTLAQVCREQRRLAYYAPATALAVNMHLYWIGVAADLWRQGFGLAGMDPAGGSCRRDLCRRPRRERQRYPDSAFNLKGRAGAWRIHLLRAETIRKPQSGMDAVWRAWDGHH